MWDVEDGGEGGLVDRAAVDGPQAAEDAEEGGFAAAVGADNEEVVALLEGEGERFNQDVTIGGDDWPEGRVSLCCGKGGGSGWTYTSMNSMSLLSMILPRPLRTAALFSVPALETSFFSK